MFNVNVVVADMHDSTMPKPKDGVPRIFKNVEALDGTVRAMAVSEEYSMYFGWLDNVRFMRVQLNQAQFDSLKKDGHMWAGNLQLLPPTWWMRILERFPRIRFGKWK